MKVFVPLALLAGFSNGFQTTQRPASVFQRSSPKLAVTPEHLNDVHSFLTDSHAWTYLADAAAATLNGAGEGSLPDALQGALEATETAIETAAQAEADVAARHEDVARGRLEDGRKKGEQRLSTIHRDDICILLPESLCCTTLYLDGLRLWLDEIVHVCW